MTPGVPYEGGTGIGRTREYFGKKNKEGGKKEEQLQSWNFYRCIMVHKAKVLGLFPKGNSCRKITRTREVAPQTRYY